MVGSPASAGHPNQREVGVSRAPRCAVPSALSPASGGAQADGWGSECVRPEPYVCGPAPAGSSLECVRNINHQLASIDGQERNHPRHHPAGNRIYREDRCSVEHWDHLLVVVGLVLAVLGSMGRAVGGRRHYY